MSEPTTAEMFRRLEELNGIGISLSKEKDTNRLLEAILMAAKKISWTNWNFSDDHRSGAVFTQGTCGGGNYGTGRLKEAGGWIRDQIRTPDDF